MEGRAELGVVLEEQGARALLMLRSLDLTGVLDDKKVKYNERDKNVISTYFRLAFLGAALSESFSRRLEAEIILFIVANFLVCLSRSILTRAYI